ncbi:hypothetical protein [Aporhodopirellula aestuarii]|uniref:Uncharacterized protein n=1 Tax=Aporhodopirellula aestuarii TaxID=2950107 RepID=A0ABT0U2D4_9BACT|nr:hypothetical protein [Aporhodopirellula aestuarii]MCM2371053.1 hypothetical protein [Aporhodopirellula aestuarii]
MLLIDRGAFAIKTRDTLTVPREPEQRLGKHCPLSIGDRLPSDFKPSLLIDQARSMFWYRMLDQAESLRLLRLRLNQLIRRVCKAFADFFANASGDEWIVKSCFSIQSIAGECPSHRGHALKGSCVPAYFAPRRLGR